jgi:hypothetical protein
MTVAAPTTITRLARALLACGLITANLCPAAEPAAAADFVVPYADKQCDDVNRAWAVMNQHTHLSIQVTIRWHAVGGMQKEETMVLPPQARRHVGCAPTLQIVSAELMQF